MICLDIRTSVSTSLTVLILLNVTNRSSNITMDPDLDLSKRWWHGSSPRYLNTPYNADLDSIKQKFNLKAIQVHANQCREIEGRYTTHSSHDTMSTHQTTDLINLSYLLKDQELLKQVNQPANSSDAQRYPALIHISINPIYFISRHLKTSKKLTCCMHQ